MVQNVSAWRDVHVDEASPWADFTAAHQPIRDTLCNLHDRWSPSLVFVYSRRDAPSDWDPLDGEENWIPGPGAQYPLSWDIHALQAAKTKIATVLSYTIRHQRIRAASKNCRIDPVVSLYMSTAWDTWQADVVAFVVLSIRHPTDHSFIPGRDFHIMEGDRKISGNTFGNDNIVIQGNATINHPAQGSQRQEKNDILKRLYTSPYQDRKDRNPNRVPGTCDWFVSHEHFRTWNESNSSAMLWVSADPGCGKSVLVKHLVDSVVPTTESRIVCYFFFKDDFHDQKSITSALSCILRQIFLQKPSLLSDEILRKFDSGGETFTTSFSELWKTLLQVAENASAGEIVCLLDAIDECEDQSGQGRSELLKALCSLYGTKIRNKSNLKFLLTSRPYVGIYRSLQPIQLPGLPVIHLSGESEDEIRKIAQEINTYIDARVKDVGERLHLSHGECNLLLKKLKSVPNRTYLWVYLVLDFIEKSINISNTMIIQATLNIPTTVNEAYERILSKSFDTAQARKALHIIVAAARPLTLREMNFALSLENGGQQSYDDLGLVPDDRFHQTLRNICGLCVVVVDSRVFLLHQTVKEFLVKEDINQTVGSDGGSQGWKCSLEPQESHRILAEICIWHLLAGLNITPGSPTELDWQRIFLNYSAKHWASHFRQMPIETQSAMTESILMICDTTSSCCRTWFEIYWTTTNTMFPGGFTTLMMASYFGLDFAVRSLLTISDIELDAQDYGYYRSALCWAARNGFHRVAKLLLSGVRHKMGIFKRPFKKRAKVDLQDIYGRAPLTYAVWNENVTLVQLLIKAGGRAHLRDEVDGTPLSYAFCNGNARIIDLLAKKKRRVDIENDINRLLLSAAAKGHEEVISLLLKTNRADIDTRGAFSQTPLILAVNTHDERIVKLLLETGADVNVHDRDGRTPLIIATSKQDEAKIKLLLESGADVNAHDRNGHTPLIIATSEREKAIVKLLIESGADVNVHTKDGRTPLIIATFQQDEAKIKLLTGAGADVNAHDRNSQTPLKIATYNRHWRIVNLLIEAGADVNAHTTDNGTCLTIAADDREWTTVKLLIKAGAEVNARDKEGQTALMRASYENQEATVKLLLEAGADVNSHNEFGQTALMRASAEGHEAIVKLLLKAGAFIDARENDSYTALIFASQNGWGAVVKLLLEAGADVHAHVGGQTALMRASADGHEATIKLLLEAGADVNAYDDYGQTALTYASWRNRKAIVKLLLEAEADINARNKDGYTALTYASQYNNKTIAEMLLEAGASPIMKKKIASHSE
ncbi:hypothetical protein MKX08_007935 [Trichoderma sp. CBMAI-0020]|nr:hypothetical protein MKX08_007935 [Trichoderma sp. CBMAI-0020]